MDRCVAQAVRTDVPPDLWRSAFVTLTFPALLWTGRPESILHVNANAIHPRRLATALWIGAALWTVGAWRLIRTRP